MRKIKPDQKGFTLIEVIVTLVLVGITAVLAGMWIVSIVNGYIFAKMNSDTTQKAQLAVTRLAKEFVNINSITSASGSAITYTRLDSSLNTTGPFSIRVQNGNKLQLVDENTGTASTLTDGVNGGGFSLRYCNDDLDNSGNQTCATDWPATGTRRIIEITLIITGANNTPSTFVKRVVPRNV